MVPWRSELKLCMEMGTHPGKVILYVWSGYPTPRVRGPYKCGSGVHAAQAVCDLHGFGCCSGLLFGSGLGLCNGLGLCSSWDFAVGVENAPGEAGYPC